MSTPIVVLGMHRSGTSAAARALGLMGAGMGPSDGLDHHWEQVDLWQLNAELLRMVGSEWDTPAALEPGWTRKGRSLCAAAEQLVNRLAAEPAWVLKDPRMCLTLPFWREQMGLEPVVVFIYRDPREVAASLHRRNPQKRLDGRRALALWERYNCDALANARDLPTIVVSYDHLLASPVETCQRVRDALVSWGVSGLNPASDAAAELDAGLRHHVTDDEASRCDDAEQPATTLTDAQSKLMALLDSLERGDCSIATAPIPSVSPASKDLLEIWRQTRRLVRAVRELKGSARQLVRLAPKITVRSARRSH